MLQKVNEVTRWRRRLDFILSSLCKFEQADPAVKQVACHSGRCMFPNRQIVLQPDRFSAMLQILRLGAYELMYGNLPGHALSDYVEIGKLGVNPGAAKFINGVILISCHEIAN